MKYRLSAKADRDILAIFRSSIQMFGLEQAERYYQGLLAELRHITEFPEAARERTKDGHSRRFHPYGSHVIIYTIRPSDVFVIRVLHGRQDTNRHLP